MKICIIIPHFFPFIGGAENLFMDFAKNLVKSGNKVRVITSSHENRNSITDINGIKVYYYNWKMLCGHPLPRKKDMEQHVQWCDILHTAPFTVANLASKIGNEYKKPVVITVHEVLGNKWNWVENNWMKAELFRIYEKFICTRKYSMYHFYSKSTQRDFEKFYGKPKEYKFFYLSVKKEEFVPHLSQKKLINNYFNLHKNQKVFLFYGRPGQSKGIFVYAKAIRILKQKNPKILKNIKFCFLMSDNPIKQKVKFLNFIKNNLLSNLVLVQPSVEKGRLKQLINEADYIVVPSITEGFGLSAVEACIMNKPILHSSGGSLPEVVFGRCLEFKNRDSVDLAKKISAIILSGDDAFINIPQKTFEEQTMVKELLSLYKSLYKQKG